MVLANSSHHLPIPVINGPCSQDDFGFRIRLYQFLGEDATRMVRHRLAVAQQHVELVAAKGLALLLELTFVCFVPHFAIAGVIEEGWETVVDVIDTEKF